MESNPLQPVGSNGTEEVSGHAPYCFKSSSGGEWRHGSALKDALISRTTTLHDKVLQREFLDWVLTDNDNVFKNKETGEIKYITTRKRGNRQYAYRKRKQLEEISRLYDEKDFDFDAPGWRSNYRFTDHLFITLSFSQKDYEMENAWFLLSSEGGELNNFGANISSIFGHNGKIVVKEAQSKGYPAAHLLIILDRPVLVKKHKSRDGKSSWRLTNHRDQARVGKTDEDRRRAFTNPDSFKNNPIWSHGIMDIKGIVRGERFMGSRNELSYIYKYMVKSIDLKRSPELMEAGSIDEISNPSLRTALWTHFCNKCFRTRDLNIGKTFKDKIGLLPETAPDEPSQWIRLRTIPSWVGDIIRAKNKESSFSVGSDPPPS